MEYPDKIYECITGGETYLVTHEEAIVLSQDMKNEQYPTRVENLE